mmetsp:Transcript_40547/g.50006  ORF Transcript_40547/g.50006 Transcript_40547/m.50006 type:complete len:226 (-) Transcript_40547:99-776(-)
MEDNNNNDISDSNNDNNSNNNDDNKTRPMNMESVNKPLSPNIKKELSKIRRYSDIPKDKLIDITSCLCGKPETHEYECMLNCGEPPCFDKIVTLPNCTHKLHQKCVDKLLYTRLGCCPICRSSINEWREDEHWNEIDTQIDNIFEDETQQAIQMSILHQTTFRRSRSISNNTISGNNNNNNNNSNNMDRDTRLNIRRRRSRSRSRDREMDRNNNDNQNRRSDSRE